MAQTLKFVLAPNAFKECLGAHEVAEALEAGVRRAFKLFPKLKVECVRVPLADGGDGTLDLLVRQDPNGKRIQARVFDPLYREISAPYGLTNNGSTAVIEMAEASGLRLLQNNEKNPCLASTYGTGQLMVEALNNKNIQTIMMCIGGSATTDGGIGMAAALGYKFVDRNGKVIEKPRGEDMLQVAKIDSSNVHPRLFKTKVLVACDVTNPLLGTRGCVNVYGPQKGLTETQRPILENGLKNMANLWKKHFGKDIPEIPGSGAAGGLGGGLMAFCNGTLRPGFDIVAELQDLDTALKGAEFCITGEGKIDDSSRAGKVPSGVGRSAQKFGVPVVAVGGGIAGKLERLSNLGIISAFTIVPGPCTLAQAMDSKTTEKNLFRTAEHLTQMWLLAKFPKAKL